MKTTGIVEKFVKTREGRKNIARDITVRWAYNFRSDVESSSTFHTRPFCCRGARVLFRSLFALISCVHLTNKTDIRARTYTPGRKIERTGKSVEESTRTCFRQSRLSLREEILRRLERNNVSETDVGEFREREIAYNFQPNASFPLQQRREQRSCYVHSLTFRSFVYTLL